MADMHVDHPEDVFPRQTDYRAYVDARLTDLRERITDDQNRQLAALGVRSDWTLSTLKEHLETGIEGTERRSAERHRVVLDTMRDGLQTQKEAINAALDAAKEAVSKAEAASEKRFDGVNEFRAALSDQQRVLMPRTEVEAILKAMAEKVEAGTVQINALIAERRGSRQFGGEIGPYILAALSIAIALFLHYAK